MNSTVVNSSGEIARLKSELHSKEEALNALKAKTKAFVDNMRSQLMNETQKVTALETKLQEATAALIPSSVGLQQQRWTEEMEKLQKETSAREIDLTRRAKAYADAMTLQLQGEKERCRNLEAQLQQKSAFAEAAKGSANHANEFDFFALPLVGASSHSDNEFDAVQSQLSSATFEMADLRQQLRTVKDSAFQSAREAQSVRQDLEGLRVASEQQQRQLQDEVDSLKARERFLQTQLKADDKKGDMTSLSELEVKLQQYENKYHALQNQLVAKDYQLEQQSKSQRRPTDCGIEALSTTCRQCTGMEEKLAEITHLYEKVNLGRSRSDSLIAETQSQLGELQTIKQQYVASQERVDDFRKQNLLLNEKVMDKEMQVTTLETDLQACRTELAELTSLHSTLQRDSLQHRQRFESIHADLRKVEETRNEVQTKCSALDKKNAELTAAIASINKENMDKRQKAKALVQTLVSEKTGLLEAKTHLQKEVERLRMEVNQRNVDNEQQVKRLRDETIEQAATSLVTIQRLTDEVAQLKHTLATVQESEKVQQRAKELAAAKREIEDSHKKRLAAKAETQKLAVELENAHKSLDHITTHVNAYCTENSQHIALVQRRVKEALDVLEKRAGVGVQTKKMPDEDTATSVRKAETLSSVRSGSGQQNPGAKRLDENVSRVSEQVRQLADVTEQLCDIAVDQLDVDLKSVLFKKLTQMFTQCFSEKLQTGRSKADEDVSLLDAHGPTSESGRAAIRPIS